MLEDALAHIDDRHGATQRHAHHEAPELSLVAVEVSVREDVVNGVDQHQLLLKIPSWSKELV